MLPRDPLKRELTCFTLAISSPVVSSFITVSVLGLLHPWLNAGRYEMTAAVVVNINHLLGACGSAGAGLLLPVPDREKVKSALIWGFLSAFVTGFALFFAFSTLGVLLGVSMPR